MAGLRLVRRTAPEGGRYPPLSGHSLAVCVLARPTILRAHADV